MKNLEITNKMLKNSGIKLTKKQVEQALENGLCFFNPKLDTVETFLKALKSDEKIILKMLNGMQQMRFTGKVILSSLVHQHKKFFKETKNELTGKFTISVNGDWVTISHGKKVFRKKIHNIELIGRKSAKLKEALGE